MNLKPLYDVISKCLGLRRDRADRLTLQSQGARLALILKSGKLRVWVYRISNRHYITLSEDGTYEQEYNPVEFSQQFDRDDFETLRGMIFDVCEGKCESVHKLVRGSRAGRSESLPPRVYEMNVSVARRDKRGLPSLLLGIQHDVSQEYHRQSEISKLLMRYQTVFNSSLIDMLYYDRNGVLRDINEKACAAFGVPNRDMVIDGSFLLENNPMFEKIPLEQMENTQTSSVVDFADYKEKKYRIDEFRLAGKMYYESTINPIRNKQGELEGIFMAGRNITEMVESYHHQQDGIRQLKRANKDIEEYIANINYALRVSDVRLVNYYPQTYTLELSNNVSQSQLRLSQLRCIRLATVRFRRTVNSVLNRMDHLTRHPIAQTIETEIRDKKGRQIWLLFNMVPMVDADGHVERYFGMCRDITEQIETEQRLAVESRKAHETEQLKQAFLTNMSYEIRTPLNTVLGFAELIEAEHDPADEPFFVEQIKKSSNELLMLVNDILFLSRLDANMIEYNKTPNDFALYFDNACQMGWSAVSRDIHTVIENPYNHLVVDVDKEHLSKVIEKFCFMASCFTRQGAIRAKYEYRGGQLVIIVEDSGMGIDSETLPHIFDRFGYTRSKAGNEKDGGRFGTGLDLPIAQAIVQQMGGTLEVQSEKNVGTTVWVTIPCTATVIEKKELTA